MGMLNKAMLKNAVKAGLGGIAGFVAANMGGSYGIKKNGEATDWKASGHTPAMIAAGVGIGGAMVLKKNAYIAAGFAGGALVAAGRFESAFQIVSEAEKNQGVRKKTFWDSLWGLELSGDADGMVSVPQYVLDYARQKIEQSRMSGNTSPLSGNTSPLQGLPQTIVLAGNGESEDAVFYQG